MGFYGKVINYITRAFNGFRVKQTVLTAEGAEDILNLEGDNWIDLTPAINADGDKHQNKKIVYSHNDPQAVNSDKDKSHAEISNSDISANKEGSKISINIPQPDAKGHIKDYKQIDFNINIASEVSERKHEDEALSGRIGYHSTEDTKSSGAYIYIEANATAIAEEVERALGAEDELSRRIGAPAKFNSEGKVEQSASGVYEYVDETKKAILGEGLKDTFDTLVEIQEWIVGNGVDTIGVLGALAEERQARMAQDEEFKNKFSNEIEPTLEDLDKCISDNSQSINEIIAVNTEQTTQLQEHETVLTETIPSTYETKEDAQSKLKQANTYTNEQINGLNYSDSYGLLDQYVASIRQENGVIIPSYQPLPFQIPEKITIVYDEEKGSLTFPSCFEARTNN